MAGRQAGLYWPVEQRYIEVLVHISKTGDSCHVALFTGRNQGSRRWIRRWLNQRVILTENMQLRDALRAVLSQLLEKVNTLDDDYFRP